MQIANRAALEAADLKDALRALDAQILDRDIAHGRVDTPGVALLVKDIDDDLDEGRYGPAIGRAWRALSEAALHPDGFLGYVQRTGKDTLSSQTVSYDSLPDFEDYGLGALLLTGSAILEGAARKIPAAGASTVSTLSA